MKDTIIKKIKDLEDDNQAIYDYIEYHTSVDWYSRIPVNLRWEKICEFIDRLYTNNVTIRILKERLSEME